MKGKGYLEKQKVYYRMRRWVGSNELEKSVLVLMIKPQSLIAPLQQSRQQLLSLLGVHLLQSLPHAGGDFRARLLLHVVNLPIHSCLVLIFIQLLQAHIIKSVYLNPTPLLFNSWTSSHPLLPAKRPVFFLYLNSQLLGVLNQMPNLIIVLDCRYAGLGFFMDWLPNFAEYQFSINLIDGENRKLNMKHLQLTLPIRISKIRVLKSSKLDSNIFLMQAWENFNNQFHFIYKLRPSRILSQSIKLKKQSQTQQQSIIELMLLFCKFENLSQQKRQLECQNIYVGDALEIISKLIQFKKLGKIQNKQMTAVYANFFNPQTLSLLFCLHELQKMAESRQVDMKSELVNFLLNKILSISDASKTATTNIQFEAQLLSVTNNDSFLLRYRSCIEVINCFDKFYGEVSNILKNLRSLRSGKLEQSNLVDFFVRRLYIYFEKLDFKQIVQIYQEFQDYLNGVVKPLKQHEFMLTKSIQQVKFNLQNYPFKINSDELEQLIQKIAQDDHTFKTSYLKGIIYAQKGAPAQSSHYLRRYFDKNLSNLFQDRASQGISSNKINHCILSGAYSSLQLQHLDQCLQAISQGLRISQNNADEESINNCIIYLYHVAERLGKFRQQILLAQHAITHSLNQNNLSLTLYSCLSCSLFEKKYDCADSSLSLLKTREVSWKDALHFAKKKLHSHYENNCRNIFHLYRNLMIPSFIHKLAILAQIPSLKNLLINPYYDRKELLELTIYKQFQGKNELSQKINKASRYSKMCFDILLQNSLIELQQFSENCAPFQRIKINALKNQIYLRQGSLTTCYNNAQELLTYCKNQGFNKIQYVDCLLMIAKVLSLNQLHYDALFQIQEAIRLCVQYNLSSQKHYCEIIKANILLKVGHLSAPIDKLRQIEEKGLLTQLNTSQLHKFYETKLSLNQRVLHIVTQSYQKQAIQKNILSCFQQMIKLSLQQNELSTAHREIIKMYNFVAKHPVFMTKAPVLEKAEAYCKKMRETFRKCEFESANDEDIVQRAIIKLKRLLAF